jgi:hypothetical protein
MHGLLCRCLCLRFLLLSLRVLDNCCSSRRPLRWGGSTASPRCFRTHSFSSIHMSGARPCFPRKSRGRSLHSLICSCLSSRKSPALHSMMSSRYPTISLHSSVAWLGCAKVFRFRTVSFERCMLPSCLAAAAVTSCRASSVGVKIGSAERVLLLHGSCLRRLRKWSPARGDRRPASSPPCRAGSCAIRDHPSIPRREWPSGSPAHRARAAPGWTSLPTAALSFPLF